MKSSSYLAPFVLASITCLLRDTLAGSYHNRKSADQRGVRVRIEQLHNNTFLAIVLDGQRPGNMSESSIQDILTPRRKEYDANGALYYVVAVILMYGFSIILMIGSLIRKNKQDQQAHRYFKDISKVRQVEKRQEKFKARLLINSRGAKIKFGRDVLGLNFKGMGSPSTSSKSTLEGIVTTPLSSHSVASAQVSVSSLSPWTGEVDVSGSPLASPSSSPARHPEVFPDTRAYHSVASSASGYSGNDQNGEHCVFDITRPLLFLDSLDITPVNAEDGQKSPRSPRLDPLHEVDEDNGQFEEDNLLFALPNVQ